MTLLLLFSSANQGGQGTPPGAIEGQPATVRSQSIPYMSGYRERSGGWNFRLLGDWLDKARRVVTLIWKVTNGTRLPAASSR